MGYSDNNVVMTFDDGEKYILDFGDYGKHDDRKNFWDGYVQLYKKHDIAFYNNEDNKMYAHFHDERLNDKKCVVHFPHNKQIRLFWEIDGVGLENKRIVGKIVD